MRIGLCQFQISCDVKAAFSPKIGNSVWQNTRHFSNIIDVFLVFFVKTCYGESFRIGSTHGEIRHTLWSLVLIPHLFIYWLIYYLFFIVLKTCSRFSLSASQPCQNICLYDEIRKDNHYFTNYSKIAKFSGILITKTGPFKYIENFTT